MYNNRVFKLCIKLYLLYWIILLIIVFILKFSIYRYASENKLFQLSMIYILGYWIPLMIIGSIEGIKSDNYLKEFHNKEYEEMHTVLGMTGISGIMNTSKWRKFLKSNDNFGDPNIEDIKKNDLVFEKLRNTAMIAAIIVFLLIMKQ